MNKKHFGRFPVSRQSDGTNRLSQSESYSALKNLSDGWFKRTPAITLKRRPEQSMAKPHLACQMLWHLTVFGQFQELSKTPHTNQGEATRLSQTLP